MEKKRSLHFVGRIHANDCGRPLNLFCTWQPKTDNLMHEYGVSTIFRGWGWPECKRGRKVERNADAEVLIEGHRYYLENDTGSMTHAQVFDRWKAYEGANDFVLIVTSSEERMEGLMKKARGVPYLASIALFAVMETLLENPRETLWADCHGETTALWK